MPDAGLIGDPAHELNGLILNDKWKVIEKNVRPSDATGGYFSVGYIVKDSTGHKAFLKALDFSKPFRNVDPSFHLQIMTAAFNFEREVLKQCKDHRLTHVVFAIDEGTINFPNWKYPVQFLIFDLAKADIRSLKNVGQAFDLAWTLRSLHQIAVGVWQLHKIEIAHQDLRPSNVLVYEGDILKVADLGRSECRNRVAPHSEDHIPGAASYAPPEFLYREISSDWGCRRFGCDLYHLGSMVIFFFCGMQMTPMLKSKLHENHLWTTWRGTY